MNTLPSNPSGPLYSPAGSITRSSYWLRILTLVGIAGATVWVFGDGRSVLGGTILIGALLLVPLQVAKRLHDIGWSGWWALLVVLPPLTPLVLMVVGIMGSSPSKQGELQA